MSNTITIELCQEDRKRLDEIVGFLGWIASELKSRPVSVETATAPATEEKPAQAIDFPVVNDETPFDEPAPAAEPERPAYTLDDIQALVVKLAAPTTGKKDKVRAIVKEYAERVSLIKPEDFSAVMDKLTALDKEAAV